MSPLDIIKEIKERLDVLDFEKLWPQLKRYPFALVSEELVYFESGKIIEKDNSFLGNTAIAYEESYLAIWQLEFAMDDLDGWTAQIVHEMVHANQYQAKDSRFVKDLKMLDYPNDLSNYQNKAQENIILVNDEVDAITRLSQIIASRKRRYESLKDYQYAESMIETIEGLAEYIALKVLKQLNPKKAIQQRQRLQDNLIHPKYYFDIRRQSYFFGALFLELIEQTTLSLKTSFTQSETFYQQIELQVPMVVPLETKIDLSKAYAQRQQYKLNLLNQKHHPQEMQHRIIGYDPMNMMKIEPL